MAAISGQPAPKPASLGKPVPGAEQQDEMSQFMAEFSVPSVSSESPEMGQFQAEMGVTPSPQGPQDFQVEEPASLMNPQISKQLEEAPTRIAAAIAGDPASVKLTLEKKYGAENVRERGGKFFFKKPGKEKFTELDPDTFEVVNDLFSDMYKDYLMAAGGAVGGAGGTALGGPGVGTAAGMIGGAAAGSQAADVLGQTRYGVVKAEPKGALETTGEKLVEGATYYAADRILGAIGGKVKGFFNRRAELKNLAEVSPVERLNDGVRNNLETLADMRNMGLVQPIPGTNVEIPAHQLLPNLPEVQKVAMSVSGEKSFQNAQKMAAENISNSVMDLVENAANLSKGKISKAVKTGVPQTPEVTAGEVVGLFNKVRREEGAIIGEFRKFVRAEAEKAPIPSPRTSQAVSGIFERLGVSMNPKNGKLVFPDDDSLVQLLGNKDVVPGFKKDLQMLNDRLVKGGLNIDELIGQSQVIGAKNDGARRIGGTYKQMIGELSSAIRADSRNGVQMVLPEAEGKIYAERMKKYGEVSAAMEQLGSFMNDELGANTFAKGLVNKGKDGIANLRAAKEFLLAEDPAMYRKVIGQYMEELALKHRDPSQIGGFNAKAMRKELASLGGEYLDELFPKNGPVSKDIVLRSFDLADQVGKSVMKAGDEELLKDAQKAVSALSWYHRGVNSVSAMLHFGSKDARLMKLLSKEGVESFLKETPKKNQEAMRQVLTGILEIGKLNGTLRTVDMMPKPQLNFMSGVPGFEGPSMGEQVKEVRKGTPVGL